MSKPYRGPAAYIGPDKSKKLNASLIEELQGKERDYPIELNIGYKRIIKGDFGGKVEQAKE